MFWVYDISWMIVGVFFMVVVGYGLMCGVYICVDFFYRNWLSKM